MTILPSIGKRVCHGAFWWLIHPGFMELSGMYTVVHRQPLKEEMQQSVYAQKHQGLGFPHTSEGGGFSWHGDRKQDVPVYICNPLEGKGKRMKSSGLRLARWPAG